MNLHRKNIRCVLFSDSRGNNFGDATKYDIPTDIKVDFVCVRGANIERLTAVALDYLREQPLTGCLLFVKIAAGINDLLFKCVHPGGVEIDISDISADEVIDKLKLFREKIKGLYPDCLCGFVTIPTAHIQTAFETNSRLTFSKFSDDERESKQKLLNEKINLINSTIRFENYTHQSNHFRGCYNVDWAETIIKPCLKRRHKNAPPRHSFRHMYGKLYDGLHGNSDVKHVWFGKVVAAFRAEATFTVADRQSEGLLSDSDTEDQEYWKRQKRR